MEEQPLRDSADPSFSQHPLFVVGDDAQLPATGAQSGHGAVETDAVVDQKLAEVTRRLEDYVHRIAHELKVLSLTAASPPSPDMRPSAPVVRGQFVGAEMLVGLGIRIEQHFLWVAEELGRVAAGVAPSCVAPAGFIAQEPG